MRLEVVFNRQEHKLEMRVGQSEMCTKCQAKAHSSSAATSTRHNAPRGLRRRDLAALVFVGQLARATPIAALSVDCYGQCCSF